MISAKDSVNGDRDAETAWNTAERELAGDGSTEYLLVLYARTIAAELRAARVFANYRDDRERRLPLEDGFR